MSIEAMKQALEALEELRLYPETPEYFKRSKAITSLRQAIKEHALREVQRLGQEIEQEPFVLKAHQWEVTKKGTKNLIQVGTLSLGGIEENTDDAEFSESDIDRLEDVIEALQEKLVTGRDQVKVPLLAYVETLQVDAPPQRTEPVGVMVSMDVSKGDEPEYRIFGRIYEVMKDGEGEDEVTYLAIEESRNFDTPPQRPRVVFPTMLRKMWSGGEVQAWLDENANKEKNNA